MDQQKLTLFYQFLLHYNFTLYMTRCMWVEQGDRPPGGVALGVRRYPPQSTGELAHTGYMRIKNYPHIQYMRITASMKIWLRKQAQTAISSQIMTAVVIRIQCICG